MIPDPAIIAALIVAIAIVAYWFNLPTPRC